MNVGKAFEVNLSKNYPNIFGKYGEFSLDFYKEVAAQMEKEFKLLGGDSNLKTRLNVRYKKVQHKINILQNEKKIPNF